MMAAVTFSSTKPNSFDGRVYGMAKLLQIANGGAAPVDVSGTVEYVPSTVDAFDTVVISIEKIVQNQ